MVGLMKPIRLIQNTSAQNSDGRWVETAANSYNIFGELVKTGSGRSVNNGQTQFTNTIRFKIRFRDDFDVSGDWRLVWAGKQYTISGIDRVDEKRFNWEITATSSGKS
jgi:SPP1 family predicted phage head-tail adaptor